MLRNMSGTPLVAAFALAFSLSTRTIAESIAQFVETTGIDGAFDARGTTGVGARFGPAKYAPPKYPSGYLAFVLSAMPVSLC